MAGASGTGGQSDRETVESATCDLQWKVATGMVLDHHGFDPSTSVHWRQQLVTCDRSQRINEAVREVVAATGVVCGRRGGAAICAEGSTMLDMGP